MSDQLIYDMPFPMIIGVCSNKVRPRIHTGRKDGHAWWARDVWHVRASGMKTACGLDSSEYLNMGEMTIDAHLCRRCVKKVRGEP